MRIVIAALICGTIGALLFLAAIWEHELPESLAVLNWPGLMLAFALIHASQGELGQIAIVAGAVLQFLIFAGNGAVLGALSYVALR